jgi:hypothetical protein
MIQLDFKIATCSPKFIYLNLLKFNFVFIIKLTPIFIALRESTAIFVNLITKLAVSFAKSISPFINIFPMLIPIRKDFLMIFSAIFITFAENFHHGVH